jgi:ferredoxin
MPFASALRIPRAALAGGISCAVLLTACGGDEPTEDAAGSSSAPASNSSSAPAESSDEATGLAAGLLPAEAFGEQATVIPLSREQLRQSAGLAADPADLTVSPEGCADVLSSTQPPIDDYEDAAAQSATVGATTTVEVLLEGEVTSDAVTTLARAAESCPEAQISSPELGDATLTFETLDAPATGDAVAAVQYTTTLTQGGQEVSVPALVGLVQDGDRLITLLTIATDGSNPDATAFTSLLQQAFEVQAEELG